MKKTHWALVAGAVALAGLGAWGSKRYWATAPAAQTAAGAVAGAGAAALPAQESLKALQGLLANYRQIIVLFAGESGMAAKEREAANRVGHALFHDNIQRKNQSLDALRAVWQTEAAGRVELVGTLLDYIESDAQLFDADRLAFREWLRELQDVVAQDRTLPAIRLHKRMAEDLDAMAEIERMYEKEISQVFGRFESRAIELKRERWDDYLRHLAKFYSREQILKDQGVILPYPQQPGSDKTAQDGELFGRELPPKTLALTFDDGPHNAYTNEVVAILKQYGVPAVFFQVGSNLGRLDADGKPRLGPGAKVSQALMEQGYVVGNHSLTHAQLSKQTGDALKNEILSTDTLLKAVDPRRSFLFRFPYGARNSEGLGMLQAAHLRSVMWNIDSLDWADPVPSSIASRVLAEVQRAGKGIVLFHDIHERTVKALPMVLDRLVADGYQFAGWNGESFSATASAKPAAPVTAAAVGGYANSWAIVIGVDDYAQWPKLQYAVRDARAVRDTLVQQFGFPASQVITLENGEATRTGILGAFHDRLAHAGMKKDDRLLVFFAGHGATRRLASGRDLGYIVPADASADQLATEAIAMTELQNIAESVAAKHTLFVVDACYSGLGLTRGGGAANFLRDNAKRIGRQMLTAGGADQLVADGGPGGHSVFTWTLLQGLSGKADLNGDGLITATELAAYVAPAVSAVSAQTPAFGSLPGSQGGDFIFELPAQTEFLSAQTQQLGSDAIVLNRKLDATATVGAVAPAQPGNTNTAAVGVTVKDLQGQERQLALPAAVPVSQRQQAQRANDRGLQLYKEQRYEQAQAQFTEALKLRPDFALAANNLGFVYFKQERYREAARWFENALAMDPSRAVAYLNLGDAYAKAGDTDKAQKAYRTYLELVPNGPSAARVKELL